MEEGGHYNVNSVNTNDVMFTGTQLCTHQLMCALLLPYCSTSKSTFVCVCFFEMGQTSGGQKRYKVQVQSVVTHVDRAHF